MAQWRNWSGSVEAHPRAVFKPRTEAELSTAVAQAQAVRVVGAGHSFMPLCATDGLLLNLSELEGELVVSADRRTVDAPAGWSLARLTEALWAEGLSLSNQGDVNPQTLAGAISTGTHGTGKALGSLATIARGFRFVRFCPRPWSSSGSPTGRWSSATPRAIPSCSRRPACRSACSAWRPGS